MRAARVYHKKKVRRDVWQVVVQIGTTPEGDPHYTHATFYTEAEALAYAEAQNRLYAFEGEGTPMSDYLAGWLADQRHLRDSTRLSYQGHVDRFLSPTLGKVDLERLTVLDIQVAYDQLRKNGISEQSLKRVHATLSSALTSAVRGGLIPINPAATLRPSTLLAYQARVWSRHEAAKFLEATATDSLAPLWRLALVTGLRRGEILGLRWRDVDLERGTVTVTQTRTEVAGKVIVGPPKSRRGRRRVAIDARTVVALAQYRRAKAKEFQRALTEFTGEVLVFNLAYLDEGIPPAWISRRMGTLCDEHGLPRIRFHDMRHTSATLGLASGESLAAVSARLGHSSLTTTADLYLQVPEEVARRSVVELASVLDGDSPLDAA
jgi:integrase